MQNQNMKMAILQEGVRDWQYHFSQSKKKSVKQGICLIQKAS